MNKKYARFCTFRNTDGDLDCNYRLVDEAEMQAELLRKTGEEQWATHDDVIVYDDGKKIIHKGDTVVCWVLI